MNYDNILSPGSLGTGAFLNLETWIVRIVSPLNLAPEMNTFINLNDQR
jgi:hypothetical protein